MARARRQLRGPVEHHGRKASTEHDRAMAQAKEAIDLAAKGRCNDALFALTSAYLRYGRAVAHVDEATMSPSFVADVGDLTHSARNAVRGCFRKERK